jgi:hypothetical protein
MWPYCRRSRLVLAGLLAFAPAALAESASAAECPSSTVTFIRLLHGDPFTTDAVKYDSTFTPDPCGEAHMTFDKSLGVLSLSASSSFCGSPYYGWLTAAIKVTELFDVTGVAPGTPVNATLIYHLDGTADNACSKGSFVLFSGHVYRGADYRSFVDCLHYDYCYPPCNMNTTLTLPVTIVAGTPLEASFDLYYETPRFANLAKAQGTGSYGVVGLPPGVRAIACSGSDVTPAHRTSWGDLKVRYR